jgi:hypothetical protein
MNPNNSVDKPYEKDYNERMEKTCKEQEFEDLPGENDEIED